LNFEKAQKFVNNVTYISENIPVYLLGGRLIAFKTFHIDILNNFLYQYIDDYQNYMTNTSLNSEQKKILENKYIWTYGSIIIDNRGIDEFFLNKYLLKHIIDNNGIIGCKQTYSLSALFIEDYELILNNPDNKNTIYYLNKVLTLPEHMITNNIGFLLSQIHKLLFTDIVMKQLSKFTPKLARNIYNTCNMLYQKFIIDNKSFLLLSEKSHKLIFENYGVIDSQKLLLCQNNKLINTIVINYMHIDDFNID
jgi:hypothetical protein